MIVGMMSPAQAFCTTGIAENAIFCSNFEVTFSSMQIHVHNPFCVGLVTEDIIRQLEHVNAGRACSHSDDSHVRP